MDFPKIIDTSGKRSVDEHGQRDMTRVEKFRHAVDEKVIFPLARPFAIAALVVAATPVGRFLKMDPVGMD